MKLSENQIFKLLLIAFCHFLLIDFALSQDKKTVKYENFLLQKTAQNKKIVDIVFKLLETHCKKLEEFYQIKLSKEVKIVIAESPHEFQKFSQRDLPKWAGAVYLPSKRTILVRNPKWAGSIKNLETEFKHELSHLYFDSKFVNIKIPLWYNEGLAELLSGEQISIFKALKLANTLAAGKTIPLEEIEDIINFRQPKAALAYLQSLSAVQFLRSILSKKTRQRNFHNQVILNGWENSLQEFAGMDDLDFELAWNKQLEKKYKWLIVLNFENVLWIALVILIGIAFVLRQYRNKRKKIQWQNEELDN